MPKKKYDFSGWATRSNVRCSDGRIIANDAFKHDDGATVPLVWNHQHDSSDNILGHALLEHRDGGVYTYCKFNNTPSGENAKMLVHNQDVTALSIYANHLQERGSSVIHGDIKEVSLVLSGANPEAYIDSVMKHGDYDQTCGVIFNGDGELLIHSEDETDGVLAHEDEPGKKTIKEGDKMSDGVKTTNEKDENEAKDENEETVQDVFNTLSEKQKTVVYGLIGACLEDDMKHSDEENLDDDNEGDDDNMKKNIFDAQTEGQVEGALTHSDVENIIGGLKSNGTLKHSAEAYGFENIDFLFPEAKADSNQPVKIQRSQDWVADFISSVHHTPFSRVKTLAVDLTEDEARARGYVKGKKKIEAVYGLLKRKTTPTTIYKKQKLDRDDIADITDFDVVAFIKSSMRGLLDEEIARAVLVGDGRLDSSDDKISPLNIRPVWGDDEVYTYNQVVKVPVNANDDTIAANFIKSAIKSRKHYKGSGKPNMYINEDMLTNCLLMEDKNGRAIYESEAKLATALRVKELITVPVMEGLTREKDSKSYELMGIILNPKDYTIGADKGGAVNMFEDFDIDYNAEKYLIETRCSGALNKPSAAISVELLKED